MSKAFTKEDETGELPALPRLVSPLPPGTKNYLTAAGSRRLHEELADLLGRKRPALLVAAQNDGEAKRQLQALDQRITYLQASLQAAEVVPLPAGSEDRVRFGATVTVREHGGATSSYRIVGVDEAEPGLNRVSWQSPIARALLNARLGQQVPFSFPAGRAELEIVKIEYV